MRTLTNKEIKAIRIEAGVNDDLRIKLRYVLPSVILTAYEKVMDVDSADLSYGDCKNIVSMVKGF